MGSHSRTTLVWVALRQRRLGALGSAAPRALKILSWRARKARSASSSEATLRATVTSTMEPEEMSGGRRMDGNSIWHQMVRLTLVLFLELGSLLEPNILVACPELGGR